MEVLLALILGLVFGAAGGVWFGKQLKPKKQDEAPKRTRIDILEDRIAELERRKR